MRCTSQHQFSSTTTKKASFMTTNNFSKNWRLTSPPAIIGHNLTGRAGRLPMRTLFLLILLLPLTGVRVPAQTPATRSCELFVLKKTKDGVAIEVLPLNEGAVKVFPINKDSDNITLVFPYGPGQSGDLIKLSESRFLIAHCL